MNKLLFVALILASTQLTLAEGKKKIQTGTSAIDEEYLDKEATQNKLENEEQHQKMEEKNKEDIESFKYDPWTDSEVPGKGNKINNRDPRD